VFPESCESMMMMTCNATHVTFFHCLSNALHSSIGQNIKSLACPISVKNFKWS